MKLPPATQWMLGILACTAVILSSCASLTSKTPYAQIDDSYVPAAAHNIERAEILGVDGEMFIRQRPIRLEPGPHAILVRSLKKNGRSSNKPDSQTLYLKTEACTLYQLAAQHECSICREWQTTVVNAESIPGCTVETEPVSNPESS